MKTPASYSFLRSLLLATALLSGCNSLLPAPAPPTPTITIPVPTPTVVTIPSPAPTIPGDPFQKGIDRAASATNLARTAQVMEDWKLVFTQWQQAITFMQAVPKTSPNYKAAQRLLLDYRQALSRAQQLAKQGERQPPPPITTAEEGGIPFIAGGQNRRASPQATSPTEALDVIRGLNQQQISFFSQQKRFAASLPELGSKIPADTPTYAYNTIALQPAQSLSTAVAKQDKLSSYSGAVFVVGEGEKSTTVAIVCRSNKPSRTPPTPVLEDNEPACPEGASRVEG